MYVLGTAGHIDHGKSSIIKQLTGIDPDRLPEEKERGLTIDLGFAWMQLPSGERVGFVDVPGHEKFVKNMIAGVGSIDAALLVIAADDGWMPQTEEHLQILELLGIGKGLIILNKTDLVEPDWVELVISDIESRLKGRLIEFTDIVPVSVTEGTGFDRLTESIEILLKHTIERLDIGKPRLYADRAFTITGMGSVLTGTLTGGKLKTGEEISIYPYNEKARIRNLQTHKETIETAVQGSRVAVNVTGGEKRNIRRGIMLSTLPDLMTASILNCRIEIPPTGKIPIKHNSEIVFLLGTAEILGKILLLEDDILKPGESGLCKIRFSEKVCPFVGDRFIIRLPSPAMTIGGGVVLDFRIKSRIRAGSRELDYLKSLYPVSTESIITSVLNLKGHWGRDEFNYVRNSIFSIGSYTDVLRNLKDQDKVLESGEIYFSKNTLDACLDKIGRVLGDHHRKSPWSPGLGAKELLDLVKIPSDESGSVLLDLLTKAKKLQCTKGNYQLPGHSTGLSPELEKTATGLIGTYLETPYESPTRSEVERKGKDYQIIIKYLISTGVLIECSGGIIIHSEIYDNSKAKVVKFLHENGKAKSSELRKILNTTRKYAIPFLEKLDQEGITLFDGEYRSLLKDA